MARKKSETPEELLNRTLILRLTEDDYNKLEKLTNETTSPTVSEVARKILFKDKITYLYRDVTMNGPMEELASIRKELRAIGININQITKAFHTTSDPNRKYIHSIQAFNKNHVIEDKVDRLLEIVSQLTLKWLQK